MIYNVFIRGVSFSRKFTYWYLLEYILINEKNNPKSSTSKHWQQLKMRAGHVQI